MEAAILSFCSLLLGAGQNDLEPFHVKTQVQAPGAPGRSAARPPDPRAGSTSVNSLSASLLGKKKKK